MMPADSARAPRMVTAIEAATRPVGCRWCGLTFATPAAHAVAHDEGRCAPPGAYGQLVDVGGVWALRGTDAARA